MVVTAGLWVAPGVDAAPGGVEGAAHSAAAVEDVAAWAASQAARGCWPAAAATDGGLCVGGNPGQRMASVYGLQIECQLSDVEAVPPRAPLLFTVRPFPLREAAAGVY